jgi:hypothetical protein
MLSYALFRAAQLTPTAKRHERWWLLRWNGSKLVLNTSLPIEVYINHLTVQHFTSYDL